MVIPRRFAVDDGVGFFVDDVVDATTSFFFFLCISPPAIGPTREDVQYGMVGNQKQTNKKRKTEQEKQNFTPFFMRGEERLCFFFISKVVYRISSGTGSWRSTWLLVLRHYVFLEFYISNVNTTTKINFPRSTDTTDKTSTEFCGTQL
jgi:hypothetical protein